MALPVIPHVYRVAMNHFDGVGASTTNVLHFQNNDDPTPLELATILNAHVTSNMWALLSNTFGGFSLDIIPLDGTSATVHTTPASAAWQGGASGTRIPEACFGLTLTTDLRGRRNRGRIFIGPVTETQFADGQLSTSPVNDSTSAWTTFANDLVADASSTALVVASYRGAVAHQVTNIQGHYSARTQRRRLLRSRTD